MSSHKYHGFHGSLDKSNFFRTTKGEKVLSSELSLKKSTCNARTKLLGLTHNQHFSSNIATVNQHDRHSHVAHLGHIMANGGHSNLIPGI